MLTRTGSLTALNALPSAIKSYDDVLNALAIINPWLSNLELPPIDIAPPRPTDFNGSKLSTSLQTIVPKLTSALTANVGQSKALKKILGVLAASTSYLLSVDYEDEITERIVNSDTFSRLLDSKLEERLAGRATGGPGQAGTSRGVSKPRKERQPDLELHLHYVLHRAINKAFDSGALTVVSDLRSWPDGTDEGYFDEVVSGRTLRRWRPVWESIPLNGPFENDVVTKVLQEWPGTYTDEKVRSAFRAYRANIVREKKKQDDGRQAGIQAEARVTKRGTDLLDSMRKYFEKSSLNRCRERAFYLAMVESRAFVLSRYASDEAHGLPTALTTLSDGLPAGYDAFPLFADLWERRRVSEKTWVAIEPPWWSEKVRFAFYLLLEESNPKGTRKSRTAMFHLPRIARPVLSASTLPKLAPPPTTTNDGPSASKRAKVDAHSLSIGMIHPSIVDDPAMSTWSSLLLVDPEIDESLPSLEDVLKATPEAADLARSARRQLPVDERLTIDQARQLWRLRSQGSDEQYDEALRASDLGAYLEGFDWENLGELYD